jgi:hypothetical protein
MYISQSPCTIWYGTIGLAAHGVPGPPLTILLPELGGFLSVEVGSHAMCKRKEGE